MISTVSLSFDLTYVDPLTGTVIPRCVVTDSTDYASIADFDLVSQQAKGYGVLTFNGDVIDSKNSVGDPLIDLQNWNFLDGTPTGYFDLPLDLNGNVANGVYGISYSLRLTEGSPAPVGIAGGTTATFSNNYWMLDFFEPGDSITLTPVLGGGSSQTRTVTAINQLLTNVSFTITPPITTFSGSATLTYDVANVQFNQTYAYAGCTQTTADLDFIYDCEYGNSGTWSVSNATVLGATEIVTSLNCVINYPSWTSSNPLFNPQVVTTVLPYPTLPGDNTPLATGTYSVSLSQQIQQTQASGLVVVYNNSVIKEFVVSCAGSLCGLIPCMENLRAAHAAELVRNRISKYQVFVDNVALYYIEAMNYRSCGEFDRYRDTINLIQAQLDASGCDCACCDDNSYYWVSNNSANSIIDEILANFQFRLYTGPGAPSATEVGVELGALWQDTTTGILYRCTGDTPGSLTWALYYDPSEIVQAINVAATATAPLTATNVQGQLNEIATNAIFGATNGLTESGDDVKLGGTLIEVTTINRGANDLTISGTTSSVSITGSDTSPSLSVSNSTGRAFSSQGVHSAGSAVLSTLDTSGSATTASPTLTVGALAFVPGNGFGSSIEFSANEPSGLYTGAMSSIRSTWQNAAAINSKLDITTTLAGVESTALTINPNGSATLPSYGTGTITGTAEYSLSVDASGNVIETAEPKVYVATLTQTGSTAPTAIEILNTTGETVTWTRSNTGEYTCTITGNAFTASKTAVFVNFGGYATISPYDGLLINVQSKRVSTSAVEVKTLGLPRGGSIQLDDGLLNVASIKIEIYP